jgi:pimeloyl-ACP methyl ester carboxylesterase
MFGLATPPDAARRSNLDLIRPMARARIERLDFRASRTPGRATIGALLCLAVAAEAPARPQAGAQRTPTVIARRLPLARGAYPPAVREALLAGEVEQSLFEDLPTVTTQAGGATNGTLSQLSLLIPQTGLTETYLFFEPLAPASPAPLMVHFHAASVSAYDLVFFTDFLDEADARNWYVLAPYQLVPQPPVTNSYSALPSQFHVEEVLAWALAGHAIDLDRIYGYGFSMGGGNALNYAARHLDRARGTFAALVNHTGTLCLTDEYRNALSPQTLRPVLEALFGGTPTTNHFEYVRSSVLDLDTASDIVLDGDHTAVNLAHVPMQSWFATGDPQAHLVRQARRFDELMSRVPSASHSIVAVAGNEHRWETLDEFLVCEWFATQSLTLPRGGELRIDRSGKYLALELTVAATDRFTRLFHDARPERFSLTRTSNLVEARLDAVEAGLDPTRVPFEVLVDTADGVPDRVVITGFTRTPGSVLRDGVATAQGFSYDGGTQVLTVEDPDGGTHLWSFQ